MTTLNFGNRTLKKFSTLWDGYATAKEAKAARDAEYWKARKAGLKARRSVLTGQLKKYDGLGQPNGGVCDVYEVEIEAAEAA